MCLYMELLYHTKSVLSLHSTFTGFSSLKVRILRWQIRKNTKQIPYAVPNKNFSMLCRQSKAFSNDFVIKNEGKSNSDGIWANTRLWFRVGIYSLMDITQFLHDVASVFSVAVCHLSSQAIGLLFKVFPSQSQVP